MPSHFHLVLRPRHDGDLSRFMQWLLTTHVRRYHQSHKSSGHVWQGRFKAFPIQANEHLLTVCRYVESNPRRAGLVKKAEKWPWSSLANVRGQELGLVVDAKLVPHHDEWRDWVNEPLTEEELVALRRSVNRGTPFGDDAWVLKTAKKLGLMPSLRPRGRPRKTMKK
jgi:putative transposase